MTDRPEPSAADPASAPGGIVSFVADQPYVLLVLSMAFWSGNYIFARAVTDNFGPAALAQARWTTALLILLPFAWRHVRRDWSALMERPLLIGVLGAIGIGIYNTFVYIGVRETTVVNATLLASTFPITVAVIGFVMYRDRLTLPQVAGIATATLGAIVVLTRGDLPALLHLHLNPGDLWILASQVMWAVYTVLLRERPRMHPLTFLAATVFVGQAVLMPYTAFEIARGMPIEIDLQTVIAVVYVAIFASLLAFVSFNRAVDLVGSNRTGPFFHLIPVFGALLAVVVLGESIEGYHLVGWALIVAGIVAAQLGARSGARLPAKV